MLFFIITLVILSPLLNLFILFSQLDVLTFSDIIERLALISLFILTGIFLWTKKSYAVKFAKVFLITTFILNILNILDIVFYQDYSYIIRGTVYFIIWILYLYKSEKVKRIYGNLKEKSEGTQIWPTVAIIYAFLAPVYGAIFAIIGLINISKNRKLDGMFLSIIALIVSIIIYTSLIFLYPTTQTPSSNIHSPTPYYTTVTPPPTYKITTYNQIDNKTINIPASSFYVYPILLTSGQNVEFKIKMLNNEAGVFNTAMFNSTEYSLLAQTSSGTPVYVYYLLDSYSAGANQADLRIPIPYDDTYYLVISTTPILKGQATYDYPLDLLLTVYTT